MTLDGTNTYVIESENEMLLIDMAEGKEQWIRDLTQVVRKGQLKGVLLTHSHVDHIGGIHQVFKEYGNVPIYRRMTENNDEEYPGIEFSHINDGETIGIPGATLQVVYTPGHKEDHVCFLLKEENALFTGDSILGRGSTYVQDYPVYMESLYRMQQLGVQKLYPAHGDTPVNANKIEENIAHRISREEQVAGVLNESGMSLEEVVGQVYPELPEDLRKVALNNTRGYLKRLRDKGVIIENQGKWTRS